MKYCTVKPLLHRAVQNFLGEKWILTVRHCAVCVIQATSALDAESEKMVQDAINKLMAGRTTVIVAHRLSTVKNADAISVLERGRVVEAGTHDSLLSNPSGVYRSLVQLQ